MYVYRARCVRVVDGDTVDLVIDLGLRITSHQRIRILGVDTPELRRGTEEEKKLGRIARDFVHRVLVVDQNSDEVISHLPTGVSPDYPILVQTHKADSFGRWLGQVFYVQRDGTEVNLSEVLLREGLAKVYSR